MDDIKTRNARRAPALQPQRRYIKAAGVSLRPEHTTTPGAATSHEQTTRTIRINIRLPRPDVRKIREVIGNLRPSRRKYPVLARVGWGVMAAVMAGTVGMQLLVGQKVAASYVLSPEVQALIGAPNERLAKSLILDKKTQVYDYNKDYTPGGDYAGELFGPKFTASMPADPKKGTSVIDPVSQTTVKFIPQFDLKPGMQDQNRLIYPLEGTTAQKIYTFKATAIKEDIILNKYEKDRVKFPYKLELPDGTEARMESNGSLGVYGVARELLGNVSTGSEKDAELLKKARAKAEKNNLLFTIPAPFIKEAGGKQSNAKAWFGYKDDVLTLYADNLRAANYPLTLDPSIYIESATKLMKGNNDTNLDFDVDNELIQKGKLTGARFNSWTSTMALPAARWNQGTAVAGGYVYVTGGSSGSTNQTTVYWAKFNTSTYAIESPNPGNGTCANWCTNSAYDLPAARAAHSMVAYNGFLYVIGGVDGSGNRTNTVYIAKLGANGEPQLWHPTGGSPVYWYSSANTISSARSYGAAAAYNNRVYYMGGQTAAATGGVNTVEYANLNPTGDVGAWTTAGMVVLPSVRHNQTIQIYNDRLYLIGGNSNGTLQNSVYYVKLASDGTMAGSWVSTTSFTTARMAWGGNFSTIWGGYIYIAGGCTALSSGNCSTIAGDVQLASINADGSITDWGNIAGVSSPRIGYGFVGWRNVLYGIGGCTAQNVTTGNCTTTSALTQYGAINQDGDASTVSNSVPSGTAPCAASTWYDCDIPPEGNGNGEGGRMSGGTVINNGFVYYFGGCTAVGSGNVCFTGNASKTADTISYAAIAADGTLVRPSVCTGTNKIFYGSWCVDNGNTLNGSTGLAAFGYTVFNNVIYAIGGTDGTTWQSNVWRTTTNADGSIGTWSSQTFANLDLGNAKGYQYVFTRANPTSASTYPGNLYVLGGCSGVTATDNGLDCDDVMYTEVYKCNIKTDGSLEELDANDCTTSGQVQIDSEPGTAGTQGLGVMAGTVYANYVYLIGGQSPNSLERGKIMYAKIDNSNNIVDVDGETVTDNIWETSANEINPVRRRGIAFGYNGYLYALAGYASGTSLNDLLFAKVDVSNGSIGTFSTSLVTVNPRWDLRAVVNNGYVYTMGGCSVGQPPASCTSMTGTLQTFQLYNNYSGSPAAYSASGNLFTTDRLGVSSAILNGYIYAAGGCTSATDCTLETNTVQYAPINPDGTIGTWAATTGNFPAQRSFGQLETVGGTLYYVGGQHASSGNASQVYYGTPSSGNVSTWTLSSNNLPTARTKLGAAVWNNRIYVTGGRNFSGNLTNTVFVSPDLSAGGDITSAWSTLTSFNVAREGHTAIAYANNLYILGGFDGTNYLNDVQYAKINSDGTIGSWSYSTSLPQRISNADGFAANGFMYLFGGRSDATTCTNNTYVAPISANTTIASGNNPTGVGEWYSTNVKFNGVRYGAAAVYDQGKAYILGGACGATLTYTGANRVVYSTLQAQPQIARYSRMIDTDLDVFPTGWLLNGLDNSIGARWTMRYRSMTDTTTSCVTPAMSTWGQDTNFGDVSLGLVNAYIPKDGSGNNTNCARYYYMAVSIDATRTFGYPEDVTRGPTIADLTLFYTSNPSKRLLHGKTFTGGEQQPLDTQCRVSGANPPGSQPNCPLP